MNPPPAVPAHSLRGETAVLKILACQEERIVVNNHVFGMVIAVGRMFRFG